MRSELVGKVRHYYMRLGIASISLRGRVKVGDTVRIIGTHSDYTQKIRFMEKNHRQVESAMGGDNIALKLTGRIKEHDIVYKILAEE